VEKWRVEEWKRWRVESEEWKSGKSEEWKMWEQIAQERSHVGVGCMG